MTKMLCVICIPFLLGCGSYVEANYPASSRDLKRPVIEKHLPEGSLVMVRTQQMVITKPRKGEWFKPESYKAFLRERDAIWKRLAAKRGVDPDLFMEDIKTKHLSRFRMLDEQDASKSSAFIVLGLLLNNGVELTFSKGSMSITFRSKDGHLHTELDCGVLLERVDGEIVTLYDTRLQPRKITNGSLKIDYESGPYPLWVRVPHNCLGMTVEAVEIDPTKLTVAKK